MSGPIIVEKSAPRALNVVGEQITVLASSTTRREATRCSAPAGPEGSGPPPHNHSWDEAFYVTRGEIAFGVEDREALARPGTFVHVPAGATHWFRFGAGGGEMVSLTSREGASKMFTEFDREINPDKPDFAKLVEVAGRHGAKIGTPTS